MKFMKSPILLFLSIILLATTAAHADEVTLDKLAGQFAKIAKPDKKSSAFEHWKYNTFAQTILFCWGQEKRKRKCLTRWQGTHRHQLGRFLYPRLKIRVSFVSL